LPIGFQREKNQSRGRRQLEIGNRKSAMFLAVAEGFEPSVTGLTIRRLTNLATPQYDWDGECVLKQGHFPFIIFHFSFAIDYSVE
jgi:hypothetical protein